MTMTLGELAELVGGELIGRADRVIEGAQPVTCAGERDITFIDGPKHLDKMPGCPAAVFVPRGIELPSHDVIKVADPLSAFVMILQKIQDRPVERPTGISPQAAIDATAAVGDEPSIHAFATIGAGCKIGARCRIHAGAVVGAGCTLGDDVTLHPHAVLYPGCVIGSRVSIHAHAVVGADGFGYRFQNGRHEKVPQLGYVEIEDDVEIGANTTIDRGTFGPTRIGQGTKIDNLVMIAHNVRIGRHNIVVSQAGFAGSSGTGDYVVVAGQVGVVGHVFIGDRSVIGGQAAVTKDVAPDSRMLGSPATGERDQKRILMSLHHLPEIRKELRELQDRIGRKEAA
ncbi:MAG: UDP-3-O-(3-hydroxymyristoyl)glucosamine N-acyltransferase [Gemmataceae bacterium]|nr:UDP-3-O-(3-hydroxymyristoyl)glucosamine N-acyltransferase [Gemmataceae bacterium]